MKHQNYITIILCAFGLVCCDSSDSQSEYRRINEKNRQLTEKLNNIMQADEFSSVTPDQIFARYGDKTNLGSEEDKKQFKYVKVRWTGTLISAKSTDEKGNDYNMLKVELSKEIKSSENVVVVVWLHSEFDPVAKEFSESGALSQPLVDVGSEVEFEGVVTGWSNDEEYGHPSGDFMINCYPARIVKKKQNKSRWRRRGSRLIKFGLLTGAPFL